MNGNRVALSAADQKLIDGFNKHGSRMGTLLIDGKQLTPAEVVQVINARITGAKAVDAGKAIWQAAVKANKSERASTRVFVAQVRQAVLVSFASSIDILADFGVTPRKQRVPKPPVQVAAAEKAKATRVARGTKGKKQKAKIKGAVPQTAPATPPALATPPATATPPAPPTPPAASTAQPK